MKAIMKAIIKELRRIIQCPACGSEYSDCGGLVNKCPACGYPNR